MQDNHAALWANSFASALAGTGGKLDPHVLEQTETIARDPARRLSSSELLQFARDHDPSFSTRLLSDWPAWGLLALAKTDGRGVGHGVGRSWSTEQTLVFLSVVRARAQGVRRRSDLANQPVFHWLLLGTDFVPLSQTRRALTTWARAARKLSAYRFRTDLYQHLLRHPEVQAALASGAVAKHQLLKTIDASLTPKQRDQAAEWISRLANADATAAELDQIARRQRHAWDALDRGQEALKDASDQILLRARDLYLQNNIIGPQERLQRAGETDVLLHWKSEGETACANAVTYLAIAADEAEHAALAELVEEGTRLSLTLSNLFTHLALTEREARDSIDRARRRRAKRVRTKGNRQRKH
jgi:hypothetical protein